MVGTTLGHYRIERELGSGGMGQVYAAEDLKLHRHVALKVLSTPFGHDDERRQRFAREAQAVAALNHPNIVTIYSVEQVGEVHFLTMEMVAGRPLSELIPHAGFSLERLLKIAIPLADAVSAAHHKGITHRDLKPANVMIADDGRVKVLDFGLAKLKEAELATPDGTVLPTQTVTGEGRILGTIAYMSPEQAEGRPLDYRSDIFSLGIVLYELATGERPFKGDTSVSVLSSILKDTPRPITDIKRAIPRDLGRIVRRCLMKDPEERYQSAQDIRNDLHELKQALDSGEVPLGSPPAVTAAGSRRLGMLIGTIALVGIVFAALVPSFRRAAPVVLAPTFTQLTAQKGLEEFPSLSPDGKWFVYAGDATGNFDIYLQSVSGQTPINLTKDETAHDLQPVFSPDGEWIAFRSSRDGGGLFVMGRTGESVRRLTDTGYNPAWSPTSKEIVFATENVVDSPDNRGVRSGLWIVNVESGEKRQVVSDDAVQPNWSPNGSRIAYWSARGAQRQRDIVTLAAGGGPPVLVTDDAVLDWNPVWSPDGRHLYFASDRGGSMNLWRVPIDEQTGRVLGSLEAITVPSRFTGHLSLSADGRRLAYSSIELERNIKRFTIDPAAQTIEGDPESVTTGSKLWFAADISPNGDSITMSSGRPQEDVFVSRADGTGLRQLTNDAAYDRMPRWSSDGKRIAFYSNRSGSWDVWSISPDGSGLAQLTKQSGAHYPLWSPDNSKIGYSEIVDVLRVSTFDPRKPWEGQTPERLPNPPGGTWRAVSWSADGKWLAGYQTAGTRPDGVVVYSFETRSFKKLSDAGREPFWFGDSRRLVFTRYPGVFTIVDRETGNARDILSRPGTDLVLTSVSRDGRRLIVIDGSKQADIWMATLH